MNEWNEYAVDSIHVSLTTQQRMLILKDVRDEIYLPIWVGSFEVDTIVIGLQEIEVSRPQTTDLLKEVIESLNGKVQRVEITKIQDETYYANIVIQSGDRTLRLDARPSDAIALAVRSHVSIFVSAAIVESAAIRPEADIRTASIDRGEPAAPIDLAGLSVFDDFLKTLGVDGDSEGLTDGPGDSGPDASI